MADLMSREEMIDRLENGADPIELSIEKWRRVRSIHPAEQISKWELASDTCALCYTNRDDCSVCKLREVMGDSCAKEEGNLWGDAVYDSVQQEDNGGVDRLIEMLKKCREVEPMGREEMMKRIEEGEDPLELSIEKWIRIKETYLDRDVADFTHGNTCPLCYVYRSLGCDECILVQKTGDACQQENIWVRADDDVRDRIDRGGVDGMIRLLEECREKEKTKHTPGPWWIETRAIHARGPAWTPDNHDYVHPPCNEYDVALIESAPDLLIVANDGNEMEDIYLSEIQRIGGPDVELSRGFQGRLHTLRQQRYVTIAKAEMKKED